MTKINWPHWCVLVIWAVALAAACWILLHVQWQNDSLAALHPLPSNLLGISIASLCAVLLLALITLRQLRRPGRPLVNFDLFADWVESGRSRHTFLMAGIFICLLILAIFGCRRIQLSTDLQTLLKTLVSMDFLVTALVLILATGWIELVLVVLIPLACALLLTFGTLGWLGQPMNQVVISILPLMFGISATLTLFYAESKHRQYCRRRFSSGSIYVAALAALLGFGWLAFAKNAILQTAGVSIVVGSLGALIANLVIVPTLVDLFLPRDYRVPPRTLKMVLRDALALTYSRFVPGIPNGRRDLLTGSDWAVRQKIQERFTYLGINVEMYVYWKLRLDILYSRVVRHLPAAGRIYDLGCGYGIMAHWGLITGPEREVIGVDADARKIEIALQTVPYQNRLAFILSDVMQFSAEPAEAVLLLDMLHYWSYPRQADLARKARSLLKPGGILLLREASMERSEQKLTSEKFSTAIGSNRKYEGLFFRTREGWIRLFTETGLALASDQICGLGEKNRLFVFKA
jgi:ubiquinone/menaquinone biosynthesis C-methylase UbiE